MSGMLLKIGKQRKFMTERLFNYDDVLEKYYSQESKNYDLAEDFLSFKLNAPRYVLGRNEHSESLLHFFDFDGVIDDYSPPGTTWLGKKVVSASTVPMNAVIVNASMSIAPVAAEKRLKSLGFTSIISYADLCRIAGSPINHPKFVFDARREIKENYDRYSNIFTLLSDSVSREVFNKVMSYRLTADYSYMNGFHVRLADQYFESFAQPETNSIFIDCGGFDGDTTEEFIKRYQDYGRVYLFEPSSQNIAKARHRLRNYRDIEFVELGLSDESGVISFDSTSGSASSVVDGGFDQITLTTLDEFLEIKSSFIKMDLEGWELRALKGSRRHLEEDRAILAIAVYHDILDFVKIPEYVLSIQKNYKLYLRHYTEGWSETVMYFIPK